AFLLIVLFVCACGGFALWLAHDLRTPVQHAYANQYIEIPRGSTPAEMFARLQSSGVIGRVWPLMLYVRARGLGGKLKAGEYRFPSPITPLQVLRKLEEGEERLDRFTIIEGWTRWDIASAMAHVPELKLRDASEALELMNDTSLIKDIDPKAENLEGYLFPDTYSFPPNTSPKEMIATMVRRFRQVWAGYEEGARASGRDAHECATVASLVETEAKLNEERPLVASVIYNRLQRGIPLGIDSTVIYASKLAGKWRGDGKVYQSDLDRDSPYNTRRVKGLPPGPIASFGARSLEAAVRPAQTGYLYYVRDPSRNDGAHNFYDNDSDFQRGVQALRAWERERDSRAAANANVSNGTNVPENANAPQ
ncbi:MAG: endolytic transglycosylase MltG, partial [Acidobacteriota bacterium]|nr:endolytic transglycosylase MltG [Acidobacteriota bacterium]